MPSDWLYLCGVYHLLLLLFYSIEHHAVYFSLSRSFIDRHFSAHILVLLKSKMLWHDGTAGNVAT